jgi:hypothetical protein
MTNWMYTTVQGEDAARLGLDELGRKGWELVSVAYDGRLYSAFLKRPANIGSLPQQVAQQEHADRASYHLSNDRAAAHSPVPAAQPAKLPAAETHRREPTKRGPHVQGNT